MAFPRSRWLGVVIVLAGCSMTTPGATPAPTPSPAITSSDFPGRSHPPRDPVTIEETTLAPGISATDASKATAIALADDRVVQRLAAVRFVVIGVTTPPHVSDTTKEDHVQELPEVIIYDYIADKWLTVPVDLATGTAHAFTEHDPVREGQPPIGEDEAARAVEIALASAQGRKLIGSGFTLNQRPVRMGRLADAQCVTSRCVLVLLDAENQLAAIQVDLGAERVVGVDAE